MNDINIKIRIALFVLIVAIAIIRIVCITVDYIRRKKHIKRIMDDLHR